VLTIDPQGRLTAIGLSSVAGNFAAADPQPILEIVVGGSEHPVESLRREGATLLASFDGGAATVRLAVEERSGHLTFRVQSVQPADAEVLRLRLALKRLNAVDPSLNGTYGDDAILCLRSVTDTTRCIYRSLPGGVPQPGVEWSSTHGIVGGAAALVAAPRASFFDAVSAMQVAEGLPSPRFDGLAARESPTARKSYLFLTYYQPGDLPSLIEYAGIGEFGLILVLRGLWRESSGTYGLDPALWPGGLPEFRAFCEQIHSAGMGVGLHLYGPSVSVDDPLVTPVPDDGLLAWPCPPLATAVDAAEDALVLSDAPDLPAVSAGGYPGRYLRVGDEILRYSGTSAGPPFTFLGCERGSLGTTAAPHAAGERPRHLATMYDLFLIDPDSGLVQTVAANLAGVVNDAGIDMVYFDGASIPTDAFVQRWYYVNRLLPAYYAAFDHPVLFQTSLGIGRELDWHLVPRSASADGHGDIKWFLDRRTPSIDSIRRGLSVPDVGWYGFDSGRPPDYLEYVCAKCLGWNCGLSVQTFRIELEKDRRARETMEMIGRYERCKRAGALPPAVRDALLVPGRDFRLLEDASGAHHLYEAAYEASRDIRTLTNGASTWSASNPEPEARILGIEITRGSAIQVDADWSDPGVAHIDAFVDVGPYTPDAQNDSARLVNRTGKTMNAAGPARAGVQHDLVLAQDANVGGPCVELTATNTNNTIGWCAVGRDFDPVLDLSSMEAVGLWLKGDKSGVEITVELYDDQDRRAVLKLPVFFDGWRFHALPLVTPAAFDRTKVKYLVVIAADIAPESSVALRFVLFRGTPAVRLPEDLSGVRIEVGGRVIVLPAPLPAGSTARIDALGQITIWPGGMSAGQTWNLAGGPVTLVPGANTVVFRTTGPDPVPGDVAVRLSLLKRIHPE
jgi:hypothetical protein